ncbi:bifunctional enzyme IspD/IspF [Alphaproteobacteria bacterium]|nr:bifunctional enzyme IspD/IspF [Alphaproteobacteria bacterium]
MVRCAVLIVAAGRGSRFGGDIPKQWRILNGRSILSHSLAVFAAHPSIQEVRAVIHPDDRALYDNAVMGLALPEPVAGGENRQDSVRLGLEVLASSTKPPDLVLIHDGARPFPDSGLIGRVIAALADHQGAVPTLPVTDSLKQFENGALRSRVRDGLWRAQTPQGFRFQDILKAHRQAQGLDLTDDAAVAERSGLDVVLVGGAEENVKITCLDDLLRAEARFSGSFETRLGSGFDVHRFTGGDHVILCGVSVPHDSALLGHSDADVALHALTDALLGAIGAGDIGLHFPSDDPKWKNVSSDLFLKRASTLIKARGGRIGNIDVTIICERPKIAPHQARMRHRLAEILEMAEDRINVKATTTEGLGFTGRGEGIAAKAVASVLLPSIL